MTRALPLLTSALLLAAVFAAPRSQAQVKPITDNGAAEGLPADTVNFEPEYRDRQRRDAGMAVPAAPGTPPSSADPHDLAGIWVVGKTYPLNDAAHGGPGGPGGEPGAPGQDKPSFNGVYGVGKRHAPNAVCIPRSAFTVGLPGMIVQTPGVIYILRNGQDGSSYRRIVLDGTAPKTVKPSYAGYSTGHWDGDALVVETVALKGRMSAGMFGGEVNAQYTPHTRVTERIRKIEGNLKLEDLIRFDDPALKQPYRARIVSYWRPDLKFVEAPCEEYSDPLETETTGPFAGGDEPQRGLPPPAAPTPGSKP